MRRAIRRNKKKGKPTDFWSLDLMVTPATLVPRPETELLVDLALREIPRRAEWDILDLGTGSGAIAVAIAKERPLSHVTATDISAAALDVARQNARHLEIPNIEFLEGNWTAPVSARKFNVIVSNPPYVRAHDTALDALHCEPRDALSAGEDGLECGLSTERAGDACQVCAQIAEARRVQRDQFGADQGRAAGRIGHRVVLTDRRRRSEGVEVSGKARVRA